MSVSDVYKKFIMNDSTRETPDQGIEIFQNNNILKYSTKNGVPSMETPGLVKNSSI